VGFLPGRLGPNTFSNSVTIIFVDWCEKGNICIVKKHALGNINIFRVRGIFENKKIPTFVMYTDSFGKP
jgi:hypothetical protein